MKFNRFLKTIFLTEFASVNNALDIWAREYYKKSKEIYNMNHKRIKKRTKRK